MPLLARAPEQALQHMAEVILLGGRAVTTLQRQGLQCM